MDNENRIIKIEEGASSSDCNGKKKGGTGRKKVEIAKIENNKTRRIVTFSKRRQGLFKKTKKLCRTISDVNLLAVTVSPAGRKTYSYSEPDRETVLTRYFRERFNTAEQPPLLIEAADVVEVEAEPFQMTTERVESEPVPDDGEYMEAQALVSGAEKLWWDKDVDELETEEEIKTFLSDLKELKTNLCCKIDNPDWPK